MCLCKSAASSASPLLQVFNKPAASGKRAVLKNPCLVMDGALEEPRLLLHPVPVPPPPSRFPMGTEQVCAGAQLGPVSWEHLLLSGAWEGKEDAEMWSGGCFLKWDAEAQGMKVVAKLGRQPGHLVSSGLCCPFA